MQMVDSHSMLEKSQMLKDEGNRLFKTQAYRLVIFRYDKCLQYLCVVVPNSDEDAKLMEELGISLNLNLAACCLKLNAYEEARNHYDLVLKLDFGNMKAQFRRAQTYLHLAMLEEAHKDLLSALEFDPDNDEVKKEQLKIERMCKSKCVNTQGYRRKLAMLVLLECLATWHEQCGLIP